jgi:hypothetical protein
MSTTPLDLDLLVLQAGAHSSPAEGMFAAGEPHSDAPQCASRVLRDYGLTLNDRWPTDHRQDLKPFIMQMIGTAGDGKDTRRRQIALDALPELVIPWLRLANLDEEADRLAATAGGTAAEIRAALRPAAKAAREARSANWANRRAVMKAALLERGVPAAAAAAAADAAADAAAAVAAAVAVAVAAAVAVAVAAAAAVAVDVAAAVDAAAAAAAAVDAAVDAAAAAAAAAAADAAVAAGGNRYSFVYTHVRKAMRAHYETAESMTAIRALRDEQRTFALDLFGRLIAA